ncbi:MAG TPA: hypothetical protein VFC53_12930 [Dehalococcoidia bacterium]|nr:hypothetical protein [Dehalococcoidia bacterium]
MTVRKSMRFGIAAAMAAGLALALAACGGGDGDKTPTPGRSPLPGASATAERTPTVGATPGATASGSAPAAVDPCTLRTSLEGNALIPGPSFALAAGSAPGGQRKWQLCVGGAAAGSSEKYLFRTTDGGATWTLISRTTLGSPTPEAGVGDFPNGNGVTVILFLDANNGWVGLNSPGRNLFRSTDGGVSWMANTDIPPALPVTSITFSSATDGTAVTPDGNYVTTDGGDHWAPAP